MKTYEITLETIGTEPYLTVRQAQEEKLNEYLVKMLEYNSIAGLLPLKSQKECGNTILNYQIGDKRKFIDLIRQRNIDTQEARLIFEQLTDAITDMSEYFLKADQCLYDLEYLYMDSSLHPYLVYLPFEKTPNENISKVWKEFFLNLLSYVSEGKQDPFYDKMMRFLIQPNFNFDKYVSFLKELAECGTLRPEPAQEETEESETKDIPEKDDNWVKTVSLQPMDEDGRTMVLDALQPHLQHNGIYIPVTHFPFTIGKGSANYIVANQTVSRHHVTLLQQSSEKDNQNQNASSEAGYSHINGEKYYIRDEKSTNGTFLNGRRLQSGEVAELHDGDCLKMSDEELTFLLL